MENNTDRRTNGNDILREAFESDSERKFKDFENETIVFRKAYKQAKPKDEEKTNMEFTAQIKSGAVVRPLKQSSRPAVTVPSGESGEESPLQLQSSANRRILPDAAKKSEGIMPMQRQTPQSDTMSKKPTTPKSAAPTAPKPAAPTAPKSAAPTAPKSAAPMAPKSAAPTAPKSAAPTAPKPAVPTTPKPAVPTAPKQRQPIKQSVNPIQRQITPRQNENLVKPSVAAPNRLNSEISPPHRPSPVREAARAEQKPHTGRTENDDFEIDEITYASNFRRKAYINGESFEATSGAVISLIKAMVYIILVIALSVCISVFVITTANDVFKFVVEDRIVSVTIPEYATVDEVADILYDAGAIKKKWAFKLWTNLKEEDAEFLAGDYEVSTALNYDYLRASFQKRNNRTEVRITIPEGYTVDEIIKTFVDKGIGTKEGFVDAINNYDFDYPFLDGLVPREGRIYRLEGYLFPDTYYFFSDSTEVAVIKKLLDNFDSKFADEYYVRCEQLGLSVDDAIILASMVEKETRYADELGYVSSVFHNRLRYPASFPYLNSDATIMYAMAHDFGERPDTMVGEDKQYDSLYNTYKYKGLPPGPIANPGLNAIKYALYPNDSDYFYFVSYSSGRTLFAKTEPEHLQNINTVRGQ